MWKWNFRGALEALGIAGDRGRGEVGGRRRGAVEDLFDDVGAVHGMADRRTAQPALLAREMLEPLRDCERAERGAWLVEGLNAAFMLVRGERGGGNGVDHVEIA